MKKEKQTKRWQKAHRELMARQKNWYIRKIYKKQESFNIGCLILLIIAGAGLSILLCEVIKFGFRLEEFRAREKFEAYQMLKTKLREQGEVHAVAFREIELSDETIIKGLIGEAIGEPSRGIIAVAWVLRNRLDNGMSIGFCALDRSDLNYFISVQPEWKKDLVRDIWNKVKSGQIIDITNGAKYFENINAFGQPYWVDHVEFVVEIGNHRFYK